MPSRRQPWHGTQFGLSGLEFRRGTRGPDGPGLQDWGEWGLPVGAFVRFEEACHRCLLNRRSRTSRRHAAVQGGVALLPIATRHLLRRLTGTLVGSVLDRLYACEGSVVPWSAFRHDRCAADSQEEHGKQHESGQRATRHHY